jgi:uncharacterized CHY-type Zn-finger protein
MKDIINLYLLFSSVYIYYHTIINIMGNECYKSSRYYNTYKTYNLISNSNMVFRKFVRTNSFTIKAIKI